MVVRRSRHAFMKRIITIIAGLIAMTGIVAAYSTTGHDVSPPNPLPWAYDLAVHTLGSATNEFVCIEAKRGQPALEWVFTFSNTNAAQKLVIVPDGWEPKCEVRDVTK